MSRPVVIRPVSLIRPRRPLDDLMRNMEWRPPPPPVLAPGASAPGASAPLPPPPPNGPGGPGLAFSAFPTSAVPCWMQSAKRYVIMSCLQPKLPCRSQVFPHPRVPTRRFGPLKNEPRRHGTQRRGFFESRSHDESRLRSDVSAGLATDNLN